MASVRDTDGQESMTAQGHRSSVKVSRSQVNPVSAHLLVDISSAIMPVMTRSQTRALAAMAQAPAQAAAAPAAAGALLSPALTATSRETAAPLVTTSSIAISSTSYIFSSTLRIVSLSWQKKWSRPRPRHRTMKQSRPGLDAPQSRPGLDGRVTTRVGTHRPWAFTIFRHAHRWPSTATSTAAAVAARPHSTRGW